MIGMNWFRLRKTSQRTEVFDPLRQKYVALTPEEEVRQLTAHRLVTTYGYPAGRIVAEFTLRSGKLERRCDLLVFSADARPWMIVECKAPGVKLSQSTLDQAVVYSLMLPVSYLLITNGKEQYCAKLETTTNSFSFLDDLPVYA